jgi:spoIIIJ-associated protein
VQQALQRLGLSLDEVEVEVIKQGSRGLLGLLSEEALVRVTPMSHAESDAQLRQLDKAPEPENQAEEPESEAPELEEREEEEQPPAASVAADQDQVAQQGAEALQKLLDYMGVPGRVSKEPMPLKSQGGAPSTLLNISGDDLGLLIGRRGETLRDLQFLTSLIVSRNSQRWPGLSVDVEHYKARREKSLIELARRMADRVRTTRQPVPLEPMPPFERRIVHLALRDDPDVRTESMGLDEKRKVVIYPKD